MTSPSRERIFAWICAFIQDNGYSPSLDEIGRAFSMTGVGAWKHVKALVAEGRLLRKSGKYRSLDLPGRVDLRPVPTDALVAELARRRAVSHAQDALAHGRRGAAGGRA